MKKILLILAVVVCVAVAGTALAVTTYNSAQQKTGTLTADTYLKLSLEDCSETGLTLVKGEYVTYTIDYDVTKSTNAPNARLNITLAATTGLNLTGMTVDLFTDSQCTTPLKIDATSHAIDAEGTAVTQSGAGTIYISGLSTSGLIYARFHLSEEANVSSIGGTMTLNLVEA